MIARNRSDARLIASSDCTVASWRCASVLSAASTSPGGRKRTDWSNTCRLCLSEESIDLALVYKADGKSLSFNANDTVTCPDGTIVNASYKDVIDGCPGIAQLVYPTVDQCHGSAYCTFIFNGGT